MVPNKQNQAQKNREKARRLKEKIAAQLKRGANKGVEAGIRFLTARVKETVSVPAPKTAVRAAPTIPGKKGAILSYRATAPAVRGAPPRVLSGKLRQGTTGQMLTPTIGLVGTHARSLPTKNHPGGFNYPRYHELGPDDQWGGGEHQFLRPTLRKWRKALRVLIGGTVRAEVRKR